MNWFLLFGQAYTKIKRVHDMAVVQNEVCRISSTSYPVDAVLDLQGNFRKIFLELRV